MAHPRLSRTLDDMKCHAATWYPLAHWLEAAEQLDQQDACERVLNLVDDIGRAHGISELFLAVSEPSDPEPNNSVRRGSAVLSACGRTTNGLLWVTVDVHAQVTRNGISHIIFDDQAGSFTLDFSILPAASLTWSVRYPAGGRFEYLVRLADGEERSVPEELVRRRRAALTGSPDSGT